MSGKQIVGPSVNPNADQNGSSDKNQRESHNGTTRPFPPEGAFHKLTSSAIIRKNHGSKSLVDASASTEKTSKIKKNKKKKRKV